MSEVACDFLERKSSSFHEKEALLLNLYKMQVAVLKTRNSAFALFNADPDPASFSLLKVM
jgi:hypothetical protein